jgi:hypothetical protein
VKNEEPFSRTGKDDRVPFQRCETSAQRMNAAACPHLYRRWWHYVTPVVRALFLTQKQQRWLICPETGVVWKHGSLMYQLKCQTTVFETMPD